MTDFPPDGGDATPVGPDYGPAGDAGVPRYLDVLPGFGDEVLVVGDVIGCRDFNHRQGANGLGFDGTCGLVSCEDVLRQFGLDVTEDDVVRHAAANGLCNVWGKPADCGGTRPGDQARILTDAGVPAHPEYGADLHQLLGWVEEGRGVILEVNAGILWNDANAFEQGQANHAVTLTGAAVSPDTGELFGFYLNDSGRALPGDSGHFVSVDRMNDLFLRPGGLCVVTDLVKTFPR